MPYKDKEYRNQHQKKYYQKNKERRNEYNKTYNAKYRLKHKEEIKNYRKEHYRKNKEYSAKYNKEWYKENVDYNKKYYQEHKEDFKKYAQKNKERIKGYMAKYHYKRGYKLTFEEIDAILISQNHKCAICGKSLMETKRRLDHDHKTGVIRGILCNKCNTGLGFFEYFYNDSELLEKVIEYIKKGVE